MAPRRRRRGLRARSSDGGRAVGGPGSNGGPCGGRAGGGLRPNGGPSGGRAQLTAWRALRARDLRLDPALAGAGVFTGDTARAIARSPLGLEATSWPHPCRRVHSQGVPPGSAPTPADGEVGRLGASSMDAMSLPAGVLTGDTARASDTGRNADQAGSTTGTQRTPTRAPRGRQPPPSSPWCWTGCAPAWPRRRSTTGSSNPSGDRLRPQRRSTTGSSDPTGPRLRGSLVGHRGPHAPDGADLAESPPETQHTPTRTPSRSSAAPSPPWTPA